MTDNLMSRKAYMTMISDSFPLSGGSNTADVRIASRKAYRQGGVEVQNLSAAILSAHQCIAVLESRLDSSASTEAQTALKAATVGLEAAIAGMCIAQGRIAKAMQTWVMQHRVDSDKGTAGKR